MDVIEHLRRTLGRLPTLDAEIRTAAPKCPECARPDAGIVPMGFTPYDSGLVDRERCPSATCPMKREA
jgi:hypothetical protein